MSDKNPAAHLPDAAVMKRVELVISWLLLGGVVTSMATVSLGLLLMFVHHPEYLRSTADLRYLTTPGAAFPRTVSEVARGVVAGQGRAIVMLGLLLLIGTPVLRVAISVVGFALQRDRTYTLICTVVLIVLLISFFIGNC